MPITPQCAAKRKQFSSTYQPKHNGRHKGKSPTTCLKELMNDDVPYLNPITGVKEIDSVAYASAIKMVVKWLQDDDIAAGKEIFDRMDGKVNGNGKGNSNIIAVTIKIEGADGDKIQSSQAQSVASFQR